jgi:hypothetical protein
MINSDGFLTAMGLRTLIVRTVGKLIGNYTLPGSSTFVPAIAVLPDNKYGNNYPPPETTISGIEIVIHQPKPNSVSRLGNDRLREKKWEIFINQWDGNGDLIKIVNLLVDEFQDNSIKFTNPVFPESNMDVGIVPYCRIALIERYVRTPNYDTGI